MAEIYLTISLSTHKGDETPQNCCSGKAIRITYSECVFVALGIQRTIRKRRFAICGLSGCIKFSTSH